jgi:small subunit ribosomal protein S9
MEGKGADIRERRDSTEYFPITMQQFKLHRPSSSPIPSASTMCTARVDGGGITGQVDAVRLGIARAHWSKVDAENKPKLKAEN